jgi:multiple sugar transport system substrate-binding protein
MCSPAPEVMYCLPYTGYGSFLYRNLTVLEEAGIDPSQPIESWDDWKAQMEQVAAAGDYALPDLSQTWFGLANIYSGVAEPNEWGIDFENDTTLIVPEKLAAAAQFMIDTMPWSTGTTEDDQATADLFLSNQLAFLPGGPWLNPTFEQAAQEQGLRYDWVLLPSAEPGESAGVKGFEFIGVAPNENSDIAFKFAAYVAERAQMVRWASTLGRYVSNDAALADPAVASHPLLKITNEAAAGAIFNRPPFFQGAYPEDYWSVLLDGLAAIVEGDETPEEGAAAIVEELNAVIAESSES